MFDDAASEVDHLFAKSLWDLEVDLILQSYMPYTEAMDRLARYYGMQLFARGHIPTAGRFANYWATSLFDLDASLPDTAMFGDLRVITSRALNHENGFYRLSRYSTTALKGSIFSQEPFVLRARRTVPVLRPGYSVGWLRNPLSPVPGAFPSVAVSDFAGPIHIGTSRLGSLWVGQNSRSATWAPSERALHAGRIGAALFDGAYQSLSAGLEILQAAGTFKDQVDQFAFWTQVISPNPYLTKNGTNDIARFGHVKAGPLELSGRGIGISRDSRPSFYDFHAVGHGRYATAAGEFSFASRVRAWGPLWGPGRVLLKERTIHRHPFGSTDTERTQRMGTTGIVEGYAHVFFPARTYDPTDSVRTTVRRTESYREVRSQQGVVRTPILPPSGPQRGPVEHVAEKAGNRRGPKRSSERGGILIDLPISEKDFR